jgi:hypothetical protein
MLSKDELLQGRDETYKDEYTQAISDNLDDLLEVLNQVRAAYGKPLKVVSGWRPASINGMTKGASPKSNHMTGHACDFSDGSGEFFKWCVANLELLAKLGLYLEDKRWTPTWTHVQNIPPKSRKRIYVPSEALALAPNIWDGKYDSKWDK